jgi:hypothetical protein
LGGAFGVVVSVFAQFLLINWAILFFLINGLGQSFCPHFKKYLDTSILGIRIVIGGSKGLFGLGDIL